MRLPCAPTRARSTATSRSPRLYRQRGEIGRAIHLHQNLLLRRDLDAGARFQALVGLADDFREGGFLRRAIAAYEEVLAHQPRHARALAALVRLLVDAREAAPCDSAGAAPRPHRGRPASHAEATLWVDLAESERAEGRTQVARKALRRALRADPQSVRAWIALGLVEAELGNAEARARRVAPRAGDRSPRRPEVYPRLAATFAALGRARDYEAFLQELLASDAEDAARDSRWRAPSLRAAPPRTRSPRCAACSTASPSTSKRTRRWGASCSPKVARPRSRRRTRRCSTCSSANA